MQRCTSFVENRHFNPDRKRSQSSTKIDVSNVEMTLYVSDPEGLSSAIKQISTQMYIQMFVQCDLH